MTVMTTTVTVGRWDNEGNDDDSETMTVMAASVRLRRWRKDADYVGYGEGGGLGQGGREGGD